MHLVLKHFKVYEPTVNKYYAIHDEGNVLHIHVNEQIQLYYV